MYLLYASKEVLILRINFVIVKELVDGGMNNEVWSISDQDLKEQSS